MKKIFSVILAITFILGAFSAGVSAEMSAEDTFDNAGLALDNYFFYAELCNGYFAEGKSPSASAIYHYFLWDVEECFEDYVVEVTEYGFATYEIPAELYEEMVLAVFCNEDAVLETLRASYYYKTDKAEPYYLVEVGGGFGDYLPEVIPCGYTDNGNGTVTAYAYLGDLFDMDKGQDYVPSEDETEGVDYMYILSDVYNYDEETDTYKMGVKYAPAKLSGGLRAVIGIDEDTWNVCYYSYENVGKSDIPAAEDLTAPVAEGDIAVIGGAFTTVDRDILAEGITVYGQEYLEDDEVFASAKELVADKGVVGGVYEYSAEKNGEAAWPEKGIALSFVMPNALSPDTVVYCIAEDGTVTALETAVDPDSYDPTLLYATASLTEGGRYIVVGTPYGDADENNKVNLSDVSSMLKKIAKWDVSMNEIATDANRDGKTNLSDVSMILKHIAKWDVVFG